MRREREGEMSGRGRKVIHLIKTGIIKKRWMRRGFEREREREKG
jgi:hypothetical protein